MNVRPYIQVTIMDHRVTGHINHKYHLDLWGSEAKYANPRRRWYMDSGVVRWVRCTTSGASSFLTSELSYNVSEDLSIVP